jgi:hypothetical protein
VVGFLNVVAKEQVPAKAQRRKECAERLDQDLNHSILDHYFVGIHVLARHAQALSRAHVESPSVPIALDYVTAQISVCQRRSFVRAKILDREELPTYIEESQFSTIQKFDGRAASGRNIFRPPNRYFLAGAFWLFEVAKLRVEWLHYQES